VREIEQMRDVRVIVPLGQFGYEAVCRILGVRPRPKFGHGVEVAAPGDRTLVCSFHPSQQNTFTGKLTPSMLDDVFQRARQLAA
jgi:uracil-DNA glycosylase